MSSPGDAGESSSEWEWEQRDGSAAPTPTPPPPVAATISGQIPSQIVSQIFTAPSQSIAAPSQSIAAPSRPTHPVESAGEGLLCPLSVSVPSSSDAPAVTPTAGGPSPLRAPREGGCDGDDRDSDVHTRKPTSNRANASASASAHLDMSLSKNLTIVNSLAKALPKNRHNDDDLNNSCYSAPLLPSESKGRWTSTLSSSPLMAASSPLVAADATGNGNGADDGRANNPNTRAHLRARRSSMTLTAALVGDGGGGGGAAAGISHALTSHTQANNDVGCGVRVDDSSHSFLLQSIDHNSDRAIVSSPTATSPTRNRQVSINPSSLPNGLMHSPSYITNPNRKLTVTQPQSYPNLPSLSLFLSPSQAANAPRSTTPASAAPSSPSAPNKQSTREKLYHVLVVDDSAISRKMLMKVHRQSINAPLIMHPSLSDISPSLS